MSAARTEILERIAAATHGSAPPSAVARVYRRTGTLDAEARTALFCERAGEYRADVQRVRDAAEAVAAACRARGAHRLAVPSALPDAWRPAELELVEDAELAPGELDALDGVITGCTLAIAETGTIVLTAAPREGRRVLTLVPDLHVCIVEEPQIVELVPEAFAALAGAAGRPITFVSGPSATSDIELSRVEGVHGPRDLVVLVVSDSGE
jgi:L-lactate dehydrogenase complex protein LldG